MVNISVILMSRNDTYRPNQIGYLKETMKSVIKECFLRGDKKYTYEVILVDYNPDPNIPSMESFFPRKEYPFMKHIVFSRQRHNEFVDAHLRNGACYSIDNIKIEDREQVRSFLMDKKMWFPKKIIRRVGGKKNLVNTLFSSNGLLFEENFFAHKAFNIGLEQAEGEYILNINPDSIISPYYHKLFKNIQPNILYRAWMVYIDEEKQKILENKSKKNKYDYYRAAGDFVLLDRQSWKDVGGYLDIPHPRLVSSDSLFIFHALTLKKAIYHFYNFPFYNYHHSSIFKYIYKNINYSIQKDGLSYNHFQELQNKYFKKALYKATHKHAKRLKNEQPIHTNTNYYERLIEIKKLFSLIR